MQTVRVRADISVHDSKGNLLALVEVKNLQDLNSDVASTLFRNLITHGLQDSRFFLLVSQDIGYLWDRTSIAGIDAPAPTVDFPMAPVVDLYLPSLSSITRLSSSQLDLAVTQWLWDMAHEAENRPWEAETALAKTDFPRLIVGGRVDMEIER